MVRFCLRGQSQMIGKGQARSASASRAILYATVKPLTADLSLLFIQELLAQVLMGLGTILIPENDP